MAISNFIVKPFPPLFHIQTNNYRYDYHTKKLALKSNIVCLKTNNISTTSPLFDQSRPSLFKDKDYKLSWQEEVKRAYPLEISNQNLNDDEKLQELVDKRCIDNFRMLIVDSVQHAKAGHAGMALGMAEVAYFLYRHAMRYSLTSPKWFNRDRFVLSAGHGCLLQYVCLHLASFRSVQVYIIYLCFLNISLKQEKFLII